MENKNLEFWNRVCGTDPKITKEVKIGKKNPRVYTAIDAHHQIKNATEVWGMFGKDWGIKDSKFMVLPADSYVNLLVYTAILYYPGGEIEISSGIEMLKTGYVNNEKAKVIDGDCVKKVKTDAITKGLSYVGFNADVFLGMFDDNKYVQEMNAKFKELNIGEDQTKIVTNLRERIHKGFEILKGKGYSIADKEVAIEKFLGDNTVENETNAKKLTDLLNFLLRTSKDFKGAE